MILSVLGTFALEEVSADQDIADLHQLIQNHFDYTKSTLAEKILANWEESLGHFVKVMPTDYKRVLEELAESNRSGSAIAG